MANEKAPSNQDGAGPTEKTDDETAPAEPPAEIVRPDPEIVRLPLRKIKSIGRKIKKYVN